ncbi:hypothetical protein JRQ81_015088 [Phrynocephalus forsythii]|uniref:Lymphoid-restricted membrane protein-like n=1 Tax=Phrynocephalus forsythii TaxID=171643 RepID=A0A9Q1B4B2_9SAUR|nr:hypothetical protein JRQ81_015088 [Phrynocephalus forsythii]
MENGVMLQSKATLGQCSGELDGCVLPLDTGTTAISEGNSESMVDERRTTSDRTNQPCVVSLQERARRDSRGSRELAVHFEDTGESDEDTDPSEDGLSTSLMELSVLQRLGLHRVALTEQDIEAAFAHLALAFRCDMFTLRRRVQVEERTRNVAEENIKKELAECWTTLQKLGQACLDTRCKDMVEQLQSSLTVLAGAIERATIAAEKLGAVHQEARMSRATEVMVQHVENLKRHHLREHTELEEMKRLIQQNSRNRQLAENRDDGEQRVKHPPARFFPQGSARRRVSIAVIPRQLTFHGSENGQGSEGETIKPTAIEEESPVSRHPLCPQEDFTDHSFVLPAGSSNIPHLSLQKANSIECETRRSYCMERRESELKRRTSIGKTVEEEASEEQGYEEGEELSDELGTSAFLFKGVEKWHYRAWFSMPTYYWVLMWLFFLGIACLILIRFLELQKQYPFITSDF